MNKKKATIIIGTILAVTLGIFGGIKYYNSMPVATVNGDKITRSEFRNRINLEHAKLQFASNKKQDEKERTSSKKAIMDKMVEEKILEQEAKKENLYPKEEESLNKEVEQTASIYLAKKEDKEKFEKLLKENNVSLDDYKKSVKFNLIINKITDAMMQKIAITDEAAKKYYEQNKMKFAEKPSKFNISIIVVKDQKTMQEVSAKLKAKESFEALVKQYSTDASTKEKAGLLGDVELKAETMDNKLASVANQLKPGEVSTGDSFKGAYYLVKLNNRTDFNVKPFETVKEEVKKDSNFTGNYRVEEFNKKYNKLKTAAKIVVNKATLESIK